MKTPCMPLGQRVEEGVVPGGGVALLRCLPDVEKVRADIDDRNVGIRLVARAIQEPTRQIVANAGEEPSVVVNDILAEKSPNYGYNAAIGKFGDMIEHGILDPTKVTRSALQNAASIAGLMITTEAMISETPKEDKAATPMPGGGMDDMM